MFQTDLKSVSGHAEKLGLSTQDFSFPTFASIYVEHGSGLPDPHPGQGLDKVPEPLNRGISIILAGCADYRSFFLPLKKNKTNKKNHLIRSSTVI